MLAFLTPTSAHRGQQQYCYKVKEQSNIWHGFYTAGRVAAGESEEKRMNLEFQIQNGE